ncbi:glycoside hydrolase family 25 protein [Mucilaginibacter boryungensis]|uniref:Glycoside hydrolase family 25 protein n=1 Tax=Mucilaginibacter boryungensis TaxID=768480 RepID=A0ABR9XEX6_9SPHI|nr:glycoside hydrolase family 25 protein [Mucilaginibacter boryungensis]MBE9665937.1 glycoside hydrolase family 25 protein [Mucilaginibacter boryungensis]
MAVVKKTVVKKAPVKRNTAPRRKKSGTKLPWGLIVGFLLIILSPLYYGYVLKTFSATWRWIMDIGENPHYRTYKSFQIRIPSRYHIHGIDVSYAQGKIDWQKVRAMQEDSVRINFAFVKATEGLLKVDPYFKRNWREAPKVGITCGAYHFFRPEKNGLWQARFFLQNVNIEKGDLPPVADIEVLDRTSPQAMRKELKAFLTYVENKTRVRPIIYTNISFYADYLAGHFDEYTLWIANFHQPELAMDEKTKWQFWQHSDIARVNGINHTVDFNAFRGDSLAFTKLLVR